MKPPAVETLLPHSGSAVLLDRVIIFDAESMTTELTVRSDGLYGDEQSVPAWLGIEYMAQTVAAVEGMQRRLAGATPDLGFLLGTRRYLSSVDSFATGSILTVTVKRLIEDLGMSVFECTITGEGVEVSAKINVYQPDSTHNRVITQEMMDNE